MITSIDLKGVHVNLDKPTRRYVEKKIGMLDRYLPRRVRHNVRAEVTLKQVNQQHGNKYEAEVMLHTPNRRILAKDTTLNVLAALDIVQAKLRAQLKRYKELREQQTTHAHQR